MPQLNSDEAANDEPTTYTTEECEEEQRWHNDADLNDIKGDLVEESDCDQRSTNNNKTHSHGEPSSKDVLDRDSRDEIKGPGRPYIYPPDIGSIVSSLHPSSLFNGGMPPNGKVPYPYTMPYHQLLYGASPSPDIDSKTVLPRSHPDIPSMYSLPGQLGRIPHPLAPWHAPPLYPMCTASTMASILRYPHHPFAAFSTSAAVAASNMPRFPMGPHPHNPALHPSMIPHPALVSNGPLSNMGNGHPAHNKMDQDKPSGRHSKSEHSSHGHSKRDRPYVKKPLNAFMLYMKEQRAKVVAECTLKESAAINQILGRKWHSLSREEQQKYYELARKERQLHLQMYPGWSARDNYGKRKKRKKEKSQGECTDSCLSAERTYASLGAERLFSPVQIPGPSSNMYYDLGGCGCSHYPSPRSYGNHNSNSNNSNPGEAGLQVGSLWGRKQFSFRVGSSPSYLSDQHSSLLTDYFQRRKKKCIRYQHDDDSDEDDITSPGSPSYQGPYSHQGMQYDAIRSTSPLSLTSQSVVANGNSYIAPQTSSTSRLHSNHVSPQQQSHMPVSGIKQELRTSPLAIDGQPAMTNGVKGFEPYSRQQEHRAPSSENSFKSEGSPNSQGAASNSSHGNHNHRSNLSANRNNGNNNNNNSANDILDRHVELSIPSSDAMNRRSSLDANGLQRSMSINGEPVRKSNSFEETDMPGTSGLGSGSRHHPPSSLRHHNTSSNSNTSADSPNSSGVRTHQRSISKLSNGPSTQHMQPHPSPLHTPSGSLFFPPNSGPSPLLSPTYNHPSPNGSHFLPYPYFNPSVLAAAFGPPPSPMGLIGLSSFKSMSNSSLGGPIGGHSSGSSGGNQARVTSGAAVEGKS